MAFLPGTFLARDKQIHAVARFTGMCLNVASISPTHHHQSSCGKGHQAKVFKVSSANLFMVDG